MSFSPDFFLLSVLILCTVHALIPPTPFFLSSTSGQLFEPDLLSPNKFLDNPTASLQPNHTPNKIARATTTLRNKIPSAYDFYVGKSVELSMPDLKIKGGGLVKVDGKLDLSGCDCVALGDVTLIVGREAEVKVPSNSKFLSVFVDGVVVGDIEGNFARVGPCGKVDGVMKLVNCEVETGGWVKSIEIKQERGMTAVEEAQTQEADGAIGNPGGKDITQLGEDFGDDFMTTLKEALDGMAELQKGLQVNAVTFEGKEEQEHEEKEDIVAMEEEKVVEGEVMVVEEEVVMEEEDAVLEEQAVDELVALIEEAEEPAEPVPEPRMEFEEEEDDDDDEEEDVIDHRTDSFGNPLVPGLGSFDLYKSNNPQVPRAFTPKSMSPSPASPMLTRGEPTLKDAFDQPLVGAASPEGVEMFKRNRDEMRQARELMDSMREKTKRDQRFVGKVDVDVGKSAEYNPYKVASITKDILARGKETEGAGTSAPPSMSLQEEVKGGEMDREDIIRDERRLLEDEAKEIVGRKRTRGKFRRLF